MHDFYTRKCIFFTPIRDPCKFKQSSSYVTILYKLRITSFLTFGACNFLLLEFLNIISEVIEFILALSSLGVLLRIIHLLGELISFFYQLCQFLFVPDIVCFKVGDGCFHFLEPLFNFSEFTVDVAQVGFLVAKFDQVFDLFICLLIVELQIIGFLDFSCIYILGLLDFLDNFFEFTSLIFSLSFFERIEYLRFVVLQRTFLFCLSDVLLFYLFLFLFNCFYVHL